MQQPKVIILYITLPFEKRLQMYLTVYVALS
jgi:hypothetical protein